MVISLGIPPLPPRTAAPPWRNAWDRALYGPEGFYRANSPRDHFRTAVHGSELTAVHGSELMAEALLRLVRRKGLDTVVDVGAGRGELLAGLHRLAPDLRLLGVEVAARPAELDEAVGWSSVLPASVEGLVVAHEWLDDIPCHVVEVDESGVARVVHVDPATGVESLGRPVEAPGVPLSLGAWLAAWWPVDGRESGLRAEVGTSRDQAWADVVRRVHRGLAVAVDYGHLRRTRPPLGSLRSYLHGREVDPLPDGSRDVTAHVAVDSVAAATGSVLLRQSEALAALGVSSALPPLSTAAEDPVAYAQALSRATDAADLLALGGLGDFYWIVSGAGGVSPSLG